MYPRNKKRKRMIQIHHILREELIKISQIPAISRNFHPRDAITPVSRNLFGFSLVVLACLSYEYSKKTHNLIFSSSMIDPVVERSSGDLASS